MTEIANLPKGTTYSTAKGFFDPFGGKGKLIHQGPDFVIWEGEVAPGQWAQCTQRMQAASIFEANQKALNESEGKRFGDGQIIGSVPLDLFYSTLAEPVKNKDQTWLKKFFNDPDNRKYRKFRGKI
jgi:hypothetical protein